MKNIKHSDETILKDSHEEEEGLDLYYEDEDYDDRWDYLYDDIDYQNKRAKINRSEKKRDRSGCGSRKQRELFDKSF